MQNPRLIIFLLAALGTAPALPSSAIAAENLLRNGAFEEWEGNPSGTPPLGKPAHWLSRLPVVRAPGLEAGSRYSVILREPAGSSGANQGCWFVQPLLTPLRGGFRISFTFSVLVSAAAEFEQPFALNLYQDDAQGKKQKWICFRLERHNGRASLQPRINDGAQWLFTSETHTFDSAEYDSQSNTFPLFVSHRFSLTYEEATDSYTIECGPTGHGQFMRLSPRRAFRSPTRGTGLTQVEFFAYNQGFAIDEVKLERP